MSQPALRPFIVAKDEVSQYRLSIRETRYNSQGYPLVTTTMQEEIFPSAAAAKLFASTHFGAKPGDFATK